MKYRTGFLLVVIITSALKINAADTDSASGKTENNDWGMEIAGSYGFLIAHRDALMPLQQEHLISLEGSLFRSSDGSKKWERAFLFPEKGIHFSWIRPGSSERLGNAFAIYPYLDFPLKNGSGRHLWLRYGMGLGYIEKTFNPSDNYRNVAIGSHLNGVIHFGLKYRIQSGKSSSIDLGIQLTHFSNGSVRIPNLGINLPAASVSYRMGGRTPKSYLEKDSGIVKRPASISIMTAIGFKEVYPAEGPLYHAATLSTTYFFGSSRKSEWGIGADLFYDNSLSVRNGQLNGDSSKVADFRAGIHGAWSMQISKISLLFNMGFYPYTVFKSDGNFYHRIGLRYDFGKIFACMQLKTHYARADYIEWGIGMNIIRIKKTSSR
ncbi:MAG: acyloxyacyl hydrolase [Bacteroidota bacterium]